MKRVLVITCILAVLAAVSTISIVQTADSYSRAMEVVRGFRLELHDLLLTDGGGEPSIRLAFVVANDSPARLELDALRFSLHLNDQFISSNYEPFSLMVLDGGQQETLSFVLPVEAFYQPYLDRAEETGSYDWAVRGRYKIVLPFKEKAIWLDLRSRWNDS